MTALDLTGLVTRPAQRWGSVQLVPLVRDSPIEDLRLGVHLYGEELSIVTVAPPTVYISYVPHAFVAAWTSDGSPAAAYGTQLGPAGPGEKDRAITCVPLRFRRRIARRVAKDRLRFLPLHLALEGYLALHFGGPSLAWDEWSQRALRQGLSPRRGGLHRRSVRRAGPGRPGLPSGAIRLRSPTPPGHPRPLPLPEPAT